MKIYATDVDEEALSTGRHGRYALDELESVPPDLRERYFETRDGVGVFRADLRRAVIFGRHDLIQDPPISRIDLLVARNTLMYFVPEIQGRILTSFHFSLGMPAICSSASRKSCCHGRASSSPSISATASSRRGEAG